LVLREDVGDDFDGLSPARRVPRAGVGMNLLETVRRGLHQAESDAVAAILQLVQPFDLPFPFAPQSYGDVDDVPVRLAQEPQRQAADDHLIVRVRRKNQDLGRIGWNWRSR